MMICTFYSYKGGVGRSMALANVAELLYRRGLRVRIVDFDLEAPGLERYFDVPGTSQQVILSHRGVVDMLDSFRHLADLSRTSPVAAAPPSVDHLPVEPLESFLVPIYPARNDEGSQDEHDASLDILPAGRRDGHHFKEYSRRVLTFDWDDFFVNFHGEVFFEWFRKEVTANVDVVLIDSRTGVTEMSGVCTYHLADVVVSFVAANHQNMDGLVQVASSLANRELITHGRQGRELFQVFVPSRVANDDEIKIEKFKRTFDQRLGPFFPAALEFSAQTFIDLKLPYVPTFAYEERVAGREEVKATEADLLRAYETLAERIARLAPVDGSYYGVYFRAKHRSRAAEDLYNRLTVDQRRLFQQLITRFVRVGGERPVSAAPVMLSTRDIVPFESVLITAETAKLVTRRVVDNGKVELTSVIEDLIEGWPRLQGWLQSDFSFLRWRQRVCEALVDWERDPSSDNLLSGSLLQNARAWVQERSHDLTVSELEFIRLSSEGTGTEGHINLVQRGNVVDDMLRYVWGQYRAWSMTSYVLKKRMMRVSQLVLALTIIGTFMGSVSGWISQYSMGSPMGGDVDALLRVFAPWLAAVALGVATLLANQLLSDSERQAWIKARALAESLKSESHKYITGAPPYDDSARTETLGKRATELQGLMLGVLPEPITPEESVKHLPEARWSVAEYVQKRVREQIDEFYKPAVIRHRKAMSRARSFTLGFGVTAVILSASGGTRQAVLLAAVLGTVTTAAGAVAAWYQSGRHQQLAQNYQAAIARLENLLAQRAASGSIQLVVEAEAVFQAEHAAWLAEWQVQPAKPASAIVPTATTSNSVASTNAT